MVTKFNWTRKERCMEKNKEKVISILNKHGIIGRKNKRKIIEDFKRELKCTEEEADKLYNDSMKKILLEKLEGNK